MGGVAIVIAGVSCVSGKIMAQGQGVHGINWIGAAAILLAVFSFFEDRFGLAIWKRLGVQIAATGLLMAGGFLITTFGFPGTTVALPPVLAVLIIALFVVWMTNLYNFMDGMDGFAGGMTVIGFGAFAYLGWAAGSSSFAAVSLIIAAAAAGFLIFNFPPARIFMGDTGSSTLGLTAAAMMLWAQRDGLFPLWIGLLVFSPFIVDATVTLVRRALRGEKVWQAHKTHYYQRLVGLGWGHRRTVLWEYALMLSCVLTAIWGVGLHGVWQWWMVVAWAGAYLTLGFLVGRLERK